MIRDILNSLLEDDASGLFTAGVRDTGKLLEYNRGMAKKVEKVIKSGQLCLTLGGDHSGTPSTL